jgi:outer membrane lipoprotein-sorting protein
MVTAQVPKKVSYQGVLKDGSGAVVPDGDYDLTFRLYDVETGGTALWIETQTATVVRGVFNVMLGTSNPLNLAFDKTYWLGVRVDGNPELSPRIELNSSPYSLNSRTVEDGAITGAKIATDQVVRSVNGLTDNIVLNAGPNVSIVSYLDTLTISSTGGGAGDGHSLDAADGSPVDAVYVDNYGDVGIGTTNPGINLHIYDTTNSVTGIRLQNTNTGSTAAERIYFDNEEGQLAGIQVLGSGSIYPNRMSIFNNRNSGYIQMATGGTARMTIDETGNIDLGEVTIESTGDVGIGTSNPVSNIDIVDNSNSVIGLRFVNTNTGSSARQRIYFDNEEGGVAGIQVWGSGAASSNEMTFFNNRSGGEIRFATGARDRVTLTESGNLGIGVTNPSTALEVDGTTRTDVLTITGGADLAEPFDINTDQPLEPGSVVVIDENDPGALEISSEPYDARVAGVISGAGGINTGLSMSQEGLSKDGQNVALSGRVYVRATTANGPIQPGDLLTTSSLPGHAMKATDTDKTRGTVLGKAMSRLHNGEGLVLVLVSLQ